MPLYAFIDDSGSEPTQPVYVLGGYIAPVDYWPSVANGWGLVLEAHPKVESYKASSVWDYQKGPFLHLTAEERRSKVDALIDVVSEHNMVAISARLRWDDWRTFLQDRYLERQARDPYFFLFYALIASIVQLSHARGYTEPTTFVFDQHGDVGKRVGDWYPTFYERISDECRSYLSPKVHFATDDEVAPLQASDMLAWHHRRHILGTLNDNDKRAWLMLSKRLNSVVVESGNLANMATQLGVTA